MAFDDLLSTLGEFGRYQKFVYGLVYLFWFPAASNVLAIVYLASSADHWCSSPNLDDIDCKGLDENQCRLLKKHVSIPHNSSTNGSLAYEQCRKYDLSGVTFANASLAYENADETGDDYDVIPCDSGWEHDREWSEYTLTQSFDLVCGRKIYINFSQSMFFVGVLVGCVILGSIADRYGRKPTLLLCNFIVVGFGIGAAFAPNYATFVVLRLVQASGCFGQLIISQVIGTEFVGPSKRAFVGIFISTAFSFGYLLLTLCAYYIRNWRYLLLTINATYILYFFILILIPESVRWQISKGRFKEAKATLRKVARFNGVKLPDDFFVEHDFKASGTKDSKLDHEPNIIDLFRTPVLRIRTIILIVLWMTNNLIYYGLHLNTGNLGTNIYLGFLISGVVELVSVILCIYLIEWFGRRYSVIGCLVIAGIASLIIIFLPAGGAKTAVAMVGKFGIAGSWAIGSILVMEVLPTPVRSVGMGICSTASRIVAIATPLLLMLYDVWAPGPLVLQSAAALATSALCLILPETRGKKLPETLEDGENFGRKDTHAQDYNLLKMKMASSSKPTEAATAHV